MTSRTARNILHSTSKTKRYPSKALLHKLATMHHFAGSVWLPSPAAVLAFSGAQTPAWLFAVLHPAARLAAMPVPAQHHASLSHQSLTAHIYPIKSQPCFLLFNKRQQLTGKTLPTCRRSPNISARTDVRLSHMASQHCKDGKG